MCVKKRRPIIIGVTGGFGTGKTTVAKAFKSLGAVVLDADKMAHGTFKKDTVSYREIIKEFGRHILYKSGKIDRAKLGRFVFCSKKRLDKLCNIIHPIVIGSIKRTIFKLKNAGAIVIDAPLLIERGLHDVTDYVIVVKTSQTTQIRRAKKKTGLSDIEIIRRIKSQMPLSKKLKLADYIIDNEGGVNKTKKAVRKIWSNLRR